MCMPTPITEQDPVVIDDGHTDNAPREYICSRS